MRSCVQSRGSKSSLLRSYHCGIARGPTPAIWEQEACRPDHTERRLWGKEAASQGGRMRPHGSSPLSVRGRADPKLCSFKGLMRMLRILVRRLERREIRNTSCFRPFEESEEPI